MYIISVMIFTFSLRDFGHPNSLKSQFGHPVMKILAKSLISTFMNYKYPINPSNAEVPFVKKYKDAKIFGKSAKPCHVGIHWKALAKYSRMSTHLPRFQ